MKKLLLAFILALVPGLSFAGATLPPPSPFTPPNVSVACGTDGTAAINAALATASRSNNGAVLLPPCPQSNPILISATLLIPSNTTLQCAVRGQSWLQEKAGSSLLPFIGNTNAGGGAGQLDANIGIVNCSFDGNSANVTTGAGHKGIWLVGVANVSLIGVQVINSPWDAVFYDGNGAEVTPGIIHDLIIIGSVNQGLAVTHAQRNMNVSDVYITGTKNYGLNLDASEGQYSDIIAQYSGTGSNCTSGGTNTAVYNPGGGGTNQAAWSPCPPNVLIRNVTNITLKNVTSAFGQYAGVVAIGLKHTTLSNIVSTQDSQASCTGTNPVVCAGTWPEVQFDLNNVVGTGTSGYGENANITANGIHVGGNCQDVTAICNSAPTAGYGVYVADGLVGSCADANISAAGSGYAVGDEITLSGGTHTQTCQWKVATISASPSPGTVTSITRDTASGQGSGVYTALPAAPSATATNGAGTGLTLTVSWSSATISGNCGQLVTGCLRLPPVMTQVNPVGGWSISASASP